MNKKFAVPRGTSDILPDEIPLWEAIEAKARKVCKSYGYREIRTPVYEDTNLFERSLGQTSEVVSKQLLHVISHADMTEHKKNNDPVATINVLRPEGTASIVRAYIEHDFDKKEPLSKFFYVGPMFRGERPQKGRLRQFHQIGAEAIGPNSKSPFLDAEIIALAVHLLNEFGVKGLKLKINSLGSKEDKLQISISLRMELDQYKRDLCEDCQSRLERNVFRVLDCKNESCRKVVDKILSQNKYLPGISEHSLKYLDDVQAAIGDLGIKFEISNHLVRGLDYYTHTIFEITAEGLGSQDAVGAGGRYGGLVHELGGSENVEGIGFALGMERILLASGQAAAVPSGVDVFVIAMKEEYQSQAFLLLQQLRQAGVSANMSFTGGSMKSQMGKADKAHARFTLILGEEEIQNRTVAVKDMQKSAQEIVALDKMIEYFGKVL